LTEQRHRQQDDCGAQHEVNDVSAVQIGFVGNSRCLEAQRNQNDCEQRGIEQRVIAAESRYSCSDQEGEHRCTRLEHRLVGETGPGEAGQLAKS